MEFSLRITGPAPDLMAVAHELGAVDPAVLLDLAAGGQAMRISMMTTEQELLDCLRAAGVSATVDDITRLPSVCCGGCGG